MDQKKTRTRTRHRRTSQQLKKIQLCTNPLKLPEVLENIFPLLETPDLRSARAVNKLWNSSAAPLITSRPQTVQLDGPKKVEEFIKFLNREESVEFRAWNLKYDVTFKFTHKLERFLKRLAIISSKNADPNCIQTLNIYGDYFFRSERYTGLTPETETILTSLFSGLKSLSINNNTLAYNDFDGPPFVELTTAIMNKASGLTDLIFDHSKVWHQFVKQSVYDGVLIQAMFIDLRNLQHLELLLTDGHALAALSTLGFPKLVYFKLCLTKEMSHADSVHVQTFLESGCPELTRFDLETHSRPLEQPEKSMGWWGPLLARLPKLREFGHANKPGAKSNADGRELKLYTIIPTGTPNLECVRVNIPALMQKMSSVGLYRREAIRELVITLDDQCTDDNTLEYQTKMQKKLADLAFQLGNLQKLTIVIQSLEFYPQIYIGMILQAFWRAKLTTLEIQNYYEDFIGTLITVAEEKQQKQKKANATSILKMILELNIPPVDLKIAKELKIHYDTDNHPKAFRLDLARILRLMPKLQRVRMPARFGLSWTPKTAELPQTRQNELDNIREWFPNVNIEFF